MDGVGVRVCFRLHYSNWSGNTGRSLHTSPIFRTNVRAHRPVSSSLPSLANKNIAGRPIFHCVFPYTLTPSPFAILFHTVFLQTISPILRPDLTFLHVLFFSFFSLLLFFTLYYFVLWKINSFRGWTDVIILELSLVTKG